MSDNHGSNESEADQAALRKDLLLKIGIQQEELTQGQLENLRIRLFEAGKKTDQQLTLWALFAAATPLCLFGMVEDTSIGGMNMDASVAGTVSFLLASVFYYRIALSTYALDIWRRQLKETRRNRYALMRQNLPAILDLMKGQEPSLEVSTLRELETVLFDTQIAEYPGFNSCGATLLLALENKEAGAASARFNNFVRQATIAFFAISPYILAAFVLLATGWKWWAFAVVGAGLVVTLSANLLLNASRQGND